MSDVIRHVGDIDSSVREMLENLLGASLTSDDHVFIVAYKPGQADPSTRTEARARLSKTLANQAVRAKEVGLTEAEIDAAVDEAMQNIRPRPE